VKNLVGNMLEAVMIPGGN
jgi:hypothetical protein